MSDYGDLGAQGGFDYSFEPDFFEPGYDTFQELPDELYEDYNQEGKNVTDTGLSQLAKNASNFRYLNHQSLNKIELQPGQRITVIIEGMTVAYTNNSHLPQVIEAQIAPPVGWSPGKDYNISPKRNGHAFNLTITDHDKSEIATITKESRNSKIQISGDRKNELSRAELTTWEKKEARYFAHSLSKLRVVDPKSMMLNINGITKRTGQIDFNLAVDNLKKFAKESQQRAFELPVRVDRENHISDMRQGVNINDD